MTTYRNDTQEQPREAPATQQPPSETQPGARQHSKPGSMCICQECQEIRNNTQPKEDRSPESRQSSATRTTMVYVSPQTQQRSNQPPPLFKPGQACMCEECQDIRRDAGNTHR